MANEIVFENITGDGTTAPQSETGDKHTVLISGTFTQGTLTLEVRIKKGWAPVEGGVFTAVGAHNLTLKNVGAFRVVTTGTFTGDVDVEIY